MAIFSKMLPPGRSSLSSIISQRSNMMIKPRSFKKLQLRTLTSSPIVEELKAEIKALAATKVDTVMKIRKDTTPVYEVSSDQIFGGMRGIPAMVTETSDLDANTGIKYRGLSLFEANEKLPKAAGGGTCGLPEASMWLLLTGNVPSAEVNAKFNAELEKRAVLPEHVIATMESVPKETHPMTQLSIGLLALQKESMFAAAYRDGKMTKAEYWEYALEDAISLVAQIPLVAARIYRRTFKDGSVIPLQPGLDWAGNYAHMLGCNDSEAFKEITRLYLMLHADHEGGNVSSHTTHVVGSALSDPYYAWAAGVCGLAGPLHGLANQECLKWLEQVSADLEAQGVKPSKEVITKYAKDTLASGKVIPGFGHAVLRQTDPRYQLEHDFCKKNIPDDPMFMLADTCLEAIPPVLQATGKVKNPWPNVDALSGTVMRHYGLVEADYYTVVFAVSRSIGVMSQLVWSRLMGVPIERPNSVTLEWLDEKIAEKK